MGLGGTAKKLQKVVDVADELYDKVNDLREDLARVRDSIDETNERVSNVETELDEQRILLERIAEAEGLDTDIEEVPDSGEDAESNAVDEPAPDGDTGNA